MTQELLFAQFFMHIQTALSIISDQGQVKHVNDAFCRLLDLPEKEVIGRNLFELAQAADQPIVKGEVSRAWNTQLTTTFDFSALNKKQNAIWLKATVTPKPDSHLMFCVFTNFTHERNAHLQTEILKRNLEEAERIAHLGNWVWDIVTNDLHWSDEIYRIFGLKPQEFGATYDAFLRSVHPEDRESVIDSVNQSLAHAKPYNITHRILRPDGSVLMVQEQGEIFRDNTGKPIRMIGTVQDVTKTKRMEAQLLDNKLLLEQAIEEKTQELQDANSTLRVLIDHSPDIIFKVNDRAQILFANYPYADWEISEFVQLPLTQLIDQTMAADFSRILKSAFTTGTSHQLETPLRSKDNFPFGTYRLRIVPIRLHNHTNEALVVATDIKYQKEMEAALIHSYKMASLGEMAGGIAHEINNPLAIIRGKTEQLKERLESGQKFDMDTLIKELSVIEDSSDRIVKIIRSLRAVSRDAQDETPTLVSVEDLIEDALSLCREKLKNHGVKINVKLDWNGDITCRPVQLSQVLINLINNSFDAVEKLDAPWIEISTALLKDKVQIRVMDSGLGIPSELAPKIMQPFFTTKQIGQGTGLGLSISYSLMEQNGGLLKLDHNAPNTCFVMEFSEKLVRTPKNHNS